MTIHSYHLFLYPFQWDYLPSGKTKLDVDFESRSNLKKCVSSLLKNPKWNNAPFEIGKVTDVATDYNEFMFFYDFVRKTIYDYSEPIDNTDRLKFLTYSTSQGSFNFSVCSNDSTKSFHLTIKDVSLHLFNTGTGILTFNLQNEKYSKPEEILTINEYGRRIYPQFLGKDLST